MVHHRSIVVKYFVLPISALTVRVWVTEFWGDTCIDRTFIDHECVFRSIQYVPFFPGTLPAVRKVVSYFRFADLAGFGGNKDNTVGGTCTVDSSGSGIFQYFDRSDIIRIQVVQPTFKRHTVYNVKRIGGSVLGTNGTYPTYADLCSGTRLTGRGCNGNTGS